MNKVLDFYTKILNIIYESIEFDNIFDGMNSSLEKTKEMLDADNIIIYRQEENSKFLHFASSEGKYDLKTINKLFYEIEPKLKNKKMNLKIMDNTIDKIIFLPISLKQGKKYLILIINPNFLTNLLEEDNILTILEKEFSIILDKIELFIEMKKISEEDNLTKLGNRAYYETKTNELISKEQHAHFTYILIDLFSLKFVNDNINHAAGDEYIKESARLLKKYFPKHHYKETKLGTKGKIKTGDYVFRIGGDEFVIISKGKDMKEIEAKLKLVNEEIKGLDLGTKIEMHLGLNYGIAERTGTEAIEELYKKSDESLSKDKAKTYKKLKIERRK